jgi:hypothetical protein
MAYIKMPATLLLGAAAVAMAAAPQPPPMVPGVRFADADDVTYRILRTSANSTLYAVQTPQNVSYSAGAPMLVKLVGDRIEVGRAYATLLGNETISAYNHFAHHVFPQAALRVLFEAFADWLWDDFHSKRVPKAYLDELEGMRRASPPSLDGLSVDKVSIRFNVLGNLPADPQNLIAAIEQELEKGLPPWVAKLLNDVIAALDKCTWCAEMPLPHGNGLAHRKMRLPSSPRCDAFATWGSRTLGGHLYSSRNLDWKRNTGVAPYKLVTVYEVDGVASRYATFGFAVGLGALAGMSSAGLSVAEMNLDNSLTTFDGPPFPLRLRMVLEQATDLASAKAVWTATNNTDSMNYMIASAKENAAFAIEAIGGHFSAAPPHTAFSGFFTADDPVERAATCSVSPKGAGGTCGDGFPQVPASGGVKRIGKPLPEAVWRTNHAVHPTVMAHQEPLFNDTTFRYELLHGLFTGLEAAQTPIDEHVAVRMAATLGIKGPNFLSCDPAQFTDDYASNTMSIVYAPGSGFAYAAWEDATPEGTAWRPAACNTYVRIDLERFWAKQ